MLLLACGGGGGGGGSAAAPTTPTPMNPTNGNPDMPPTGDGGGNENPFDTLANFTATTTNSPSIETIQNITSTTNALIDISDVFQAGGLEFVRGRCTASECLATLPGDSNQMLFSGANITDISLIKNDDYFSAYSSETTNEATIEGITFARGNLTGTRMADGDPLEFETFAGWLSGSFFGVIQISEGASGSEQYRFISYNGGVRSGDAPFEAGSATWAGATVATIKADRTFILGDATVTIPNLFDTDVDLEFNNWRNINGQALPNMDPITYEDAQITSGRFELINSDNQFEVFGRFYGTGHTEVGGWFNTPTVTGAFGATRQ